MKTDLLHSDTYKMKTHDFDSRTGERRLKTVEEDSYKVDNDAAKGSSIESHSSPTDKQPGEKCPK